MKKKQIQAGKGKKNKAFPIVAIGASAGGLEAVTELLNNLPIDTGMAYVYIQHLDSHHKSMLADILGRATRMKVQQASHLQTVEPDSLYVIPPDKEMTIANGVLKLSARKAGSSGHLPIDKFFNSLADNEQTRSIGIILSGNASDGTVGVRAIKMAGGLTFAQDASAKFESMPMSAIADGHVDLVLSPKEMAAELDRLGKDEGFFHRIDGESPENAVSEEQLAPILEVLKRSSGVNFKHYKINTIKRRIIRRMLLYRLDTPAEYLRYLKQHPAEIPVLYEDLLINVTAFFRDLDTLEYLKKSILPGIVKGKPSTDAIRVWIPACSTGEEAYSYAMILTELLHDMGSSIHVQIFATDLSEQAIAKARVGVYTKHEVAEVHPKRLQRFFTKVEGGYRVNKSLRDLCVFATHNVVSDPPFSRLDIISCCNLMIYLEAVLQKKLIAIFHYSLNPDGILLLGKSETIGASRQLFSQVERKYKVYVRKNDGQNRARFEMSYRLTESDRKTAVARSSFHNRKTGQDTDFEKAVIAILLEKYVPASIVVNKELDILQLHGQVSFFLEFTAGKPSLNLLKIARAGLPFELKNAVHKSIKSGQPEKREGVEVKNNGNTFLVSIEVVPLTSQSDDPLFLVILQKVHEAPIEPTRGRPTRDQTIQRLQRELQSAKEDMRSMLEAQDAANEELQSANEEVVSGNEELQSINEELETSKEEVESTNEELMTINSELQVRNAQVSESYDYADALFQTVREPMLVLDKDLRVQSANRSFYKVFSVEEEETEGMRIYDLGNRQWNIPELRHLLEEIIPKNTSLEGFEVSHNFPSIGERIMTVNARKVRQAAQRKELILLAIEDITVKRQAEKLISDHVDELDRDVKARTKDLSQSNNALQRSNDELQQFAYVASHDLQEPLRKIMTFIDRITNLKDEHLSETAKQFFEKIVSSTKRMEKLIDDLLDFSSIAFTEKQFVMTDLNKILTEALVDLDVIISEKQARIDADHLATVPALPLQMKQLFHNMLTNSLKFAKAGIPPLIRISCRELTPNEVSERKALNEKGAYVELVFKDNGIGFSPEFAEQIFLIFQRLNDKRQFPGTGIGLALCRKIVDNHKGDIYAVSTEEGAAFHVILPVNQ